MPNTLVQVVRLCLLAQVKVRSAADLELSKILFMVAGAGADPGRRSIWYFGSRRKARKAPRARRAPRTAGGPGPGRFLPGAEELQPGKGPGRRQRLRKPAEKKGLEEEPEEPAPEEPKKEFKELESKEPKPVALDDSDWVSGSPGTTPIRTR